jgi:hypothetical protein
MPPSLAQLALPVRAWHGVPCLRHGRFVAFDDERHHRRPPKEVRYTGQPITVDVSRSGEEGTSCTHIDSGRNHGIA